MRRKRFGKKSREFGRLMLHEEMDFSSLETQRTHHPAWRLLRSDHAPLVASFLHRVFIAQNVRVMPAADLAEALEDQLYALRLQLGEEAFPKAAMEYLMLDDTGLKDRFQQVMQIARELLMDFREVEHSFRRLDRKVRERIKSGEDYLEIFDAAHSDTEDRFIAIGEIDRGIAVVVYTEREDGLIRIIGARFATKREQERYRGHKGQYR